MQIIPIFLTFDRYYVVAAEVAIYSMLKHASADYTYYIYVLHSDIPVKSQDKLRKVIRRFPNAAIHFIHAEDLEKKCYIESGRTLNAGAQRMLDFVEGRDSVDLPRTSYAPGRHPSRLDLWLPSFIGRRLQQGFRKFGSFARGFLTNEAILIGVESRTSSPVRIPRDAATMQHVSVKGLYPCGEGAGYAGGIVSAAIDGEKCAVALAESL